MLMAVSKRSEGNDGNKRMPNEDDKPHSPIINKLETVKQ